jgi:hypothetical protein
MRGVDGSTVPWSYYSVAMGILVRSAQVRDFLGESSFWITGKRQVPGLGFVGLGHSVPNKFMCLTIVDPTTNWFNIIQLPTVTRLTVHNMDNGRKATCILM